MLKLPLQSATSGLGLGLKAKIFGLGLKVCSLGFGLATQGLGQPKALALLCLVQALYRVALLTSPTHWPR